MHAKGMSGVVGTSLVLLAQQALASTGMGGLDSMFTTIDGAVGSAGYIFFIAGLVAMFVYFFSGHFAPAFGAFGCIVIVGSMVGHRAELGGMMQLALGADWGFPWPLELLP